ncbi:MAG: hypothetical protein ACI8V5_002638 [Limisphaerales bacterium]|jgi:hypothetical protein
MNHSINRREALRRVSTGLGSIAFAAMATEQSRAAAAKNPLSERQPHFGARAKHVIFLSMGGAPSHVDTFDYKPRLTADTGKPGKYGPNLMGSPWQFSQRGQGGLWISSLFPNLSRHADDLCLLRGMHCDQPNHSQAAMQTHTGNFQFVRPSMGAWTLYGLGTENSDLPGFCVLGEARTAINFGSAFLPAFYQGTKVGGGSGGGGRRRFGGGNEEVFPNIKNPLLDAKAQRTQLDLVQQLNRNKLRRDRHQPQVEGVIQSFELAYRMQTTMPGLLDVSKESEATKKLYGIGEGETDEFGEQCLLARRMVESGVRFIELTNGGWDHHRDLRDSMVASCGKIDKPIAGLLADLKQRDLLKDTLVIWAGEFGRTPHAQGGDGRDHNNKGYTTWMAGGGVKGGFSYGATDAHGYEAVSGRTHIHDWHATILHLLGLNHEKLTYRHAGRDFRLTDVHGNVAKEILA